MRDLVSLMRKRRAHIPHRSRGTIERQFGFVGRMSEGGKKSKEFLKWREDRGEERVLHLWELCPFSICTQVTRVSR